MNDHENPFSSFLEEKYERSYGIYRWDLRDGISLTVISSAGWTDFAKDLDLITSTDQLVVSPELITSTEFDFDKVGEARVLIEGRVNQVRKISAQHPETTLLLGTPIFQDEGKPKNGVIIIKAGDIIGQTAKRSGTTDWERDNFRFDPEEAPILIPGTNLGILICSDLGVASVYLRQFRNKDEILTKSGHTNLVGFNPKFIHPDSRAIIVPSCWGIGSITDHIGNMPADEYYRLQLRNISMAILRSINQINQIAIVDRAPIVDAALKESVTSKPINALYSRGSK